MKKKTTKQKRITKQPRTTKQKPASKQNFLLIAAAQSTGWRIRRSALEREIKGHVLDSATLMGKYAR